jgi:hypothetical protein
MGSGAMIDIPSFRLVEAFKNLTGGGDSQTVAYFRKVNIYPEQVISKIKFLDTIFSFVVCFTALSVACIHIAQ